MILGASLRAVPAPGDASRLILSWARHLRAANLSPRTIQSYTESARQLTDYLAAQGMPTTVAAITREHVESFIEYVLDTRKASTAGVRYRSLQQFFKWAVEDGEIAASPMARMRPPKAPEQPVPVLPEDALRRLLATCDPRTLEGRRDLAILLVFIDTGVRLAELAGLTLDDLDLDVGELRVLGKGNRVRVVRIGRKVVKALDRYLRLRDQHRAADEPWLCSA
jgi:site-specific recombinase XerC